MAERVIGGWRAPPRPEWVARVNAEARAIDPAAVVPLDAESLLAWACRNTGLEDFGDDDWREPFAVLLRGLETEADLHLMGRLAARTEILRCSPPKLAPPRVPVAVICHEGCFSAG